MTEQLARSPAQEAAGSLTTASPARSNAVAWLIGFISVYFALQCVLRVVYASGLGLDEAEQLVLTQSLAAGYGPQPPLYTWLQIAAFDLFGSGILALAIVKNALLWTTLVFMFLSSRLVLEDEEKAAAVTLALFTIPQFAWESQRALAHTVIAVAVGAITLYVFLRLTLTGRWPAYIAFGICFALGAMTKYNYPLFALALMLAGLTLATVRSRLLRLPMLAAVIIAAALLVPHVDWVLAHKAATLGAAGKLEIARDKGLLSAWAGGIPALALAVANYAVLPVAVFGLIAFTRTKQPVEAVRPSTGGRFDRRLVLRLAGFALLLVILLVLASRTTEVRDRWLHPIFFFLPLALAVAFRSRFAGTRPAMLATTSVIFALVAMIALPIGHFLPDLTRNRFPDAAPYGALSEQIRQAGFRSGYILGSGTHVAGNLKLQFPDSTVAEPEYGLWPVKPGAAIAPVLLAWNGADPEPPEKLRQLWQKLCGPEATGKVHATRLAAPYEHSSTAQYTLSVVVVPSCTKPPEP